MVHIFPSTDQRRNTPPRAEAHCGAAPTPHGARRFPPQPLRCLATRSLGGWMDWLGLEVDREIRISTSDIGYILIIYWPIYWYFGISIGILVCWYWIYLDKMILAQYFNKSNYGATELFKGFLWRSYMICRALAVHFEPNDSYIILDTIYKSMIHNLCGTILVSMF